MKIKIMMGIVWVGLVLMAASAQAKDGGQGAIAPRLEKATFAGGCFWCMESPFDKLPWVVSVTAGYTGGQKQNPTYKEVSAGGTGHAEAVQILYDPEKIAYEKLLDVFWHNIDPTVTDRQFCDVGHQYRSAIFYQIVSAGEFYPAEEYHQHYYKKNPLRYQYYRTGCGRDRRLKEIWGNADGP
jgi:peptide-methionine (S)-S-oxide reductase